MPEILHILNLEQKGRQYFIILLLSQKIQKYIQKNELIKSSKRLKLLQIETFISFPFFSFNESRIVFFEKAKIEHERTDVQNLQSLHSTRKDNKSY